MTAQKCILAATLGLALTACARNEPVPGGNFQNVVVGKVSYKGQPLPGGFVRFVGTAGETLTSIQPSGQYEMPNPPAGKVRISVSLIPPGPANKKQKPLFNLNLPATFSNPESSGLTLEVSKGRQVHDLQLE